MAERARRHYISESDTFSCKMDPRILEELLQMQTTTIHSRISQKGGRSDKEGIGQS